MVVELVSDVAKLALISAAFYIALGIYLRRRPEHRRRVHLRLSLLFVLAAAMIKITEDALGGDSGAVDKMLLLFIHNHTPAALIPAFEAVTFTGSARFLFPATLVLASVLVLLKLRPEAAFLAASVAAGALLIYAIKSIAGRDRPSLWDTAEYWGSSFPSGHTLGTAAFAMAAAVCIGRVRPGFRIVAIVGALAWVGSVGVSRLVLGVHWPTDVLAAACAGVTIPLVLSAFLPSRIATLPTSAGAGV